MNHDALSARGMRVCETIGHCRKFFASRNLRNESYSTIKFFQLFTDGSDANERPDLVQPLVRLQLQKWSERGTFDNVVTEAMGNSLPRNSPVVAPIMI